jgi:hypothetical protein
MEQDNMEQDSHGSVNALPPELIANVARFLHHRQQIRLGELGRSDATWMPI